jgi:hypothetical protein
MNVFNFIWQTLGAGAVAAAIIHLAGRFYADKSLEKHKAELGQETEKLKAELGREAETHKWKLKKKEILFEKEFEAASEYFGLRRKIEPRFRHPDMEWTDAVEDVVNDFSNTEDLLRNFIARYGPVLSQKNRDDLNRCQKLAENNQYAMIQNEMDEAEKAVEEFLKKLEDVERRFAIEIRRS